MKFARVRSVKLVPLEAADKERFVRDNQEAFLYGATQEFGLRNSDFEEDGQIISRRTILRSIGVRNAETYRIVARGEVAGGVVLKIDRAKRRGSGFGKIIDAYAFESEKRGRVLKPTFSSGAMGFTLVLPNLNYGISINGLKIPAASDDRRETLLESPLKTLLKVH